MDDSEIIELFFARSESAVTELSLKYGSKCIGLSKRIVGNLEDAEECVNEAYLGVWNAIPPARPAPLVAFVLKIVRNISVNRFEHNIAKKRQSNYQQCLDEFDRTLSDHSDTENEYDSCLLSSYIDEFLDTLDKTSRYIFVRRYWYTDSYADISEATGLREGTIRTRLSRERKHLKLFLKERGVGI